MPHNVPLCKTIIRMCLNQLFEAPDSSDISSDVVQLPQTPHARARTHEIDHVRLKKYKVQEQNRIGPTGSNTSSKAHVLANIKKKTQYLLVRDHTLKDCDNHLRATLEGRTLFVFNVQYCVVWQKKWRTDD